MDHEVVFLAFLANVNCRISGASGVLSLGLPSGLSPGTTGGRGLKAPPDPRLQGTITVGHCMSYLRHSIHTSCDLRSRQIVIRSQFSTSKVTLRLAIIFVTAASMLLFMALINNIHEIVI